MSITNIPANVNDQNEHTARTWGREDAERGDLCAPGDYFAKHDLIFAYAEAYASVKETILSANILGRKFVAEVA